MYIDVVLVEPEGPINIGLVARAMKNFGFKDLVLVNPKGLNEEAYKHSTHAQDVLKNAKVVNHLNWSDYDTVIGTTGKVFARSVRRTAIGPEELKPAGRTAVVFGRDGTGLTNEELDKCDVLCHIPTSDEYPVMNLSHAVVVLLHQLSLGKHKNVTQPATRQQKDLLIQAFKSHVQSLNHPEHRARSAVRSFKSMVSRSFLSKGEAAALLGIYKRLNG